MRAPFSWPNHFPKTSPPNITTLGLGFSMWILGGHKYLVHNTYIPHDWSGGVGRPQKHVPHQQGLRPKKEVQAITPLPIGGVTSPQDSVPTVQAPLTSILSSGTFAPVIVEFNYRLQKSSLGFLPEGPNVLCKWNPRCLLNIPESLGGQTEFRFLLGHCL